MLRDIIQDIISRLRAQDVTDVYSAFDAKAVERKGRSFFTVVGISAFESSAPIYSPYTVYVPFKAEVEINVTAPENYSMVQLYGYYDENISKAVEDMSGLTCRLTKMSVKFDSNIRRLVLTVKLAASGITKIERSSP
ncbi:hypothetical protein [Ruminococcus flavefaciens]|uniref:hypothetical protein n=1 Tax=Ruminococcus flavefaciens TaxID=1265 RepID=UPI00048A8DD3|nr:hypothetical protein [Ruminococcus flavefaciens]